jgi:hypothetical protein
MCVRIVYARVSMSASEGLFLRFYVVMCVSTGRWLAVEQSLRLCVVAKAMIEVGWLLFASHIVVYGPISHGARMCL